MADHCTANCIYLLLLFITRTTIGDSDVQRPYIESEYINYRHLMCEIVRGFVLVYSNVYCLCLCFCTPAVGLDNAAICNPSSDKVQVVEDLRSKGFRDSAILIKPSHVFETWHVKYNKHCKFKVKATKGDALFAVVQSMSFRRNGTECLDYIMVLIVDSIFFYYK